VSSRARRTMPPAAASAVWVRGWAGRARGCWACLIASASAEGREACMLINMGPKEATMSAPMVPIWVLTSRPTARPVTAALRVSSAIAVMGPNARASCRSQ
jgi:hypothetical protein